MILVDLEKGIISMSGNAMTVHAELGIALKKYHELESEHTCKKLADMHVNSLCEAAKLSDEEIEAKSEKMQKKNLGLMNLPEISLKKL